MKASQAKELTQKANEKANQDKPKEHIEHMEKCIEEYANEGYTEYYYSNYDFDRFPNVKKQVIAHFKKNGFEVIKDEEMANHLTINWQ